MDVTEVRHRNHIHEATDVTFFLLFKSRMDYEAGIKASALETPPWKWADKVLHLVEEKEPGLSAAPVRDHTTCQRSVGGVRLTKAPTFFNQTLPSVSAYCLLSHAAAKHRKNTSSPPPPPPPVIQILLLTTDLFIAFTQATLLPSDHQQNLRAAHTDINILRPLHSSHDVLSFISV